MVELVPAVCPRCGADLQLPDHLEKAHCMYCGSEIMIERKQPDVHYHGVGTLENYVKLGNRELSRAVQLEMAGIEKQVMEFKRYSSLLTAVLIGVLLLVVFPGIGFIIHPLMGVMLFIMMAFVIALSYRQLQTFLKPKTTDIDYDAAVWTGATRVFWEHIEESIKYHKKALEINPENLEADSGLARSSRLREKYYNMLDPQQQMISRLRSIEHQQAQTQPRRGCFIATAAYGSPLAEEIDVLRNWRDRRLMESIWGRVFVEAYYFISPSIARHISRSEKRRELTRSILKPLVEWVGENT